MGQLVITEYLTLDGVGQAPGGPDEDLDGGFAHGGWQAPFIDESAGAAMLEHHRAMDAMLKPAVFATTSRASSPMPR